MMPITERVKIHGAHVMLACGNGGRQKRRKSEVHIVKSTPARITLPAVGASTWASGSQVWNGNIGTLIAKASAKARKSRSWVSPPGITKRTSTGKSKV